MRSNPDDVGSASSVSPSSTTNAPRSTGTAPTPSPSRSGAASTAGSTALDSTATTDDPRGPIEIAPTTRAEAISMTERIVRRTGRPVVIKEGHPGLEAPEAAADSIPLSGNTAEDTQRALEANEALGGTPAPKRQAPEEG